MSMVGSSKSSHSEMGIRSIQSICAGLWPCVIEGGSLQLAAQKTLVFRFVSGLTQQGEYITTSIWYPKNDYIVQG